MDQIKKDPLKKPAGFGPKPPYKRNYHNNYTPKNRKNERIRASEVRVIGADGKQLGVMATQEAIRMAQRLGLDLVEVSASAKPPVCRIIDFGKFMYEQSKKEKEGKAPSSKLKEVKFRLNIEAHDYDTKLRHSEEFLAKGYKVKLTLMFKGRETEKSALGLELVKRAINDLSGMGTCDAEAKLVGRNITTIISPLAANKRKPRFIRDAELEDDEDEE